MSLTTPFENTGTWTSLGTEIAFLSELTSMSGGRLRKIPMGFSRLGRPMFAYIITSTPGEVNFEHKLLVVASQHGTEYAPREAALAFIRDLVLSEEPGTLANLPIIVIPTMNPDGTKDSTRENGQGGRDINRSHVDLSTRESRNLANLLKKYKPSLIFDGHEWSNASTRIHFKASVSEEQFSNSLRDIGNRLVSEAILSFPSGDAGLYPPTNHEGTLVTATGFSGIPSLLAETNYSDAPETRVENLRKTMAWIFDWSVLNSNELKNAKDDARRFYEKTSGDLYFRIPMFGLDTPVNQPYPLAIGTPSGYLVRAKDIDTDTLDCHGLDYFYAGENKVGPAYYVPSNIGSAILTYFLLDPRLPRSIMKAVPVMYGDVAIDRLGLPANRSVINSILSSDTSSRIRRMVLQSSGRHVVYES